MENDLGKLLPEGSVGPSAMEDEDRERIHGVYGEDFDYTDKKAIQELVGCIPRQSFKINEIIFFRRATAQVQVGSLELICTKSRDGKWQIIDYSHFHE